MIMAPISVPTMSARPPVSGVPPTATAAIASSSMPRPTRFASLAELRAITIRPAIPAHSPLMAYTERLTRATGTPASLAAASLPPTASTCRPNTVRRMAQAAAATITAIRITWTGTPSTRPRAMNWNSGTWKICRLASVSAWAMPRPAMNSTNVATIGWMRKRVTIQPLNRPNRPAISTGTTKARPTPTYRFGNGNSWPRKIIGATAPEIAISEPTDRSMPPVAITSVMPTATMTMVATWVRFTLSVCQVAKFGVTAKLNSRSSPRAASVPYRDSRAPRRLGTCTNRAGRLASATGELGTAVPVGHRGHHGKLAKLGAGQLGHGAPIPQDEHPVAPFDDFLDLGADHQDAQPLVGQLLDQTL